MQHLCYLHALDKTTKSSALPAEVLVTDVLVTCGEVDDST